MRQIAVGLVVFALGAGSFCAHSSEHRVEAQPFFDAGPGAVTLACTDGSVQIWFNWNSEIGPAGRYRRHLFLPGKLGGRHVLLPVLRGNKSTGLLDDDMQAKALISRMLEELDPKRFSVQVYPQRPGDTTWVERWFDFAQFKAAAGAAAEECHWNLRIPPHSTLRRVDPGAPFSGG